MNEMYAHPDAQTTLLTIDGGTVKITLSRWSDGTPVIALDSDDFDLDGEQPGVYTLNA